MAGAGAIGPAISLVGKAAQSGGGKSGSGGGISPQQAALAQYNMGQAELANSTNFAQQGLGASTMKSYAAAGPQFGAAMQAAGMADANAQSLQQIAQAQQNQNTQNNAFGSGFNQQPSFGSPQGGGTNTGGSDTGGGGIGDTLNPIG